MRVCVRMCVCFCFLCTCIRVIEEIDIKIDMERAREHVCMDMHARASVVQICERACECECEYVCESMHAQFMCV